jgi:hypothetical protein
LISFGHISAVSGIIHLGVASRQAGRGIHVDERVLSKKVRVAIILSKYGLISLNLAWDSRVRI